MTLVSTFVVLVKITTLRKSLRTTKKHYAPIFLCRARDEGFAEPCILGKAHRAASEQRRGRMRRRVWRGVLGVCGGGGGGWGGKTASLRTFEMLGIN
jgi:hypothetical protein